MTGELPSLLDSTSQIVKPLVTHYLYNHLTDLASSSYTAGIILKTYQLVDFDDLSSSTVYLVPVNITDVES